MWKREEEPKNLLCSKLILLPAAKELAVVAQ